LLLLGDAVRPGIHRTAGRPDDIRFIPPPEAGLPPHPGGPARLLPACFVSCWCHWRPAVAGSSFHNPFHALLVTEELKTLVLSSYRRWLWADGGS
jgi:hypothetical protein